MKNPFTKRGIANDAPSIRPKAPDSAERPMQDPGIATKSVDKPASSPSAEMPMRPPVVRLQRIHRARRLLRLHRFLKLRQVQPAMTEACRRLIIH